MDDLLSEKSDRRSQRATGTGRMIATLKLAALLFVFLAFQPETVQGADKKIKQHMTRVENQQLSAADSMIQKVMLADAAKNSDYGSGSAAAYGSDVEAENEETEDDGHQDDNSTGPEEEEVEEEQEHDSTGPAEEADYGSQGSDEEVEEEQEHDSTGPAEEADYGSQGSEEDNAEDADEEYGNERVEAMIRLSKEVLVAASKLTPESNTTNEDGHYCAECCPLAPECEEGSAILEAHLPRDDGCICCSWKCLGESAVVDGRNQIVQKVGDMWPEKSEEAREKNNAPTHSLACLTGAAVAAATFILG